MSHTALLQAETDREGHHLRGMDLSALMSLGHHLRGMDLSALISLGHHLRGMDLSALMGAGAPMLQAVVSHVSHLSKVSPMRSAQQCTGGRQNGGSPS